MQGKSALNASISLAIILTFTITYYVSPVIAVDSNSLTVQSIRSVTLNISKFSNSAKTLNNSGFMQTSFEPGSTVKIVFSLQVTSGSGSVMWAVTMRQGAQVYNMVSAPAHIDTSISTVTYSQLVPQNASGTWTATIQVYNSDGTIPLGVTTLTFTVS